MHPVPLAEARVAICRPRPHSRQCDELIEELEEMGVEAYVPMGGYRVGGFKLLGSGWAGNVFAAIWRGVLVAVKALRPDSRRQSMLRECLMASLAAAPGVAPRVYRCGRRAMIYRLVRGTRLSEYHGEPWRLRLVARRLLYKAYLLDITGVDHGELSRPGGQVLVENDDPYIIDYDSASVKRRPRNVTSVAAGISRLEAFQGVIRPSSDPEVRRALQLYKQRPSLDALEAIMEAMGL